MQVILGASKAIVTVVDNKITLLTVAKQGLMGIPGTSVVDGGTASSIYGGTPIIDGGGA